MSEAGQKVSLMEALGARLLPEHEFRSILGSCFDGAEQRDPKVVTYLRNGKAAVAAIQQARRACRAQTGPALSAEDIDEIAARVRTEATETREWVRRCFVFWLQRAEGCWRFALNDTPPA